MEIAELLLILILY